MVYTYKVMSAAFYQRQTGRQNYSPINVPQELFGREKSNIERENLKWLVFNINHFSLNN